MTDTPGGATSGNGYVRIREFHAAQERQSEERHQMEMRLLEAINEVKDCIPSGDIADRALTRADKAHDRINEMQKEDRIWNGVNSLGVIIATTVATVFGINK